MARRDEQQQKQPEKKLRALQTSAGTKAQYTRLLIKLVRELSREVAGAVEGVYREERDRIVGDASPADRLASLIAEQRKRFNARIEFQAPRLAQWFVDRVRSQVTASQRSAFAQAGIEGLTVGFETGQLTQTAVQALIAENVNLIKSIGSQYLTDVEGIVMRSVLAGRDLKGLSKELKARYDITARRAALIARDQANKATQSISRANSLDAGITRAEWIHIPGRKSSRRTHELMHGRQFDLREGLYDSDVKRKIQPGELVACFPAGSKIYDLPFANKLFRRTFTGELTALVMDDGTVLKATPNHPILTREGWKAACLINKGDYLLCKNGGDIGGIDLDADNRIATIGDLFETLHRAGVPCRKLPGGGQFDGNMPNCDVDVIDVDSLLGRDRMAALFEVLRNFQLEVPDVACVSMLLAGEGSRAHALFGSSACTGSVRRTCEALALLYGRLTHAEKCSLFLIPELYASGSEPAPNCGSGKPEEVGNFIFGASCLIHGDDLFRRNVYAVARAAMDGNFYSALPELCADSDGVETNFHSDLLQSFSGAYSVNHVRDVIRGETMSGHVYNLQTGGHWYVVNNVIVHNCNCSYRLIIDKALWKKLDD